MLGGARSSLKWAIVNGREGEVGQCDTMYEGVQGMRRTSIW